jgi:hemin uptake protein HemP
MSAAVQLRAGMLAHRHPPVDPPEHDAEALTEGGREALIRLNDQVYTLRITRQGKLLLTK